MKVAAYLWGEFQKNEIISKKYLSNMRRLTGRELLGFIVRDEDINMEFFALEEYIEAGPDGVAVKFAYAISSIKTKLKLLTDLRCENGRMVFGAALIQ